MTRSAVGTVLSVYDALARKDVAAITQLTAPEIEIRQSTELPWGGIYHGAAEAMAFFGKVTSFLDSRVTVERLLDAGDTIAVVGRTLGTVRATTTPFDVPLVHVWEVSDGRIARLTVVLDNPTMLPGIVCEVPSAA